MTEQQPKTGKAPKGRSPSFPSISLKTAVERAGIAHEKLRQHQAPVKSFTDLWGYKSPTTGPASVTFAALKKYGLVEDEGTGKGRTAKLTDLAVEILMKEDPLPAIRRAALMPPIHAEMWDEHKADVPPVDALRYEFVVKRGFTESGLRDFLREYTETINYAQLASAGTVTEEDEGSDEVEEEAPDENTGDSKRRQRQRGEGVLTYAVPVAAGTDITIEGRFPLTEPEWVQFLAVLSAMKPGLVAPTGPDPYLGIDEDDDPGAGDFLIDPPEAD
jgi:hypothetical protein